MKRSRLALAAAAALCALLAAPAGASADICDYTGVGTWETGANWSCMHAPAASDLATIGSGDAVTLNGPTTVGVLSLDSGGQLAFGAGSPALTVTFQVVARSGTLTGEGGVIAESSATFFKTTPGTLTVQNGADLVVNATATQDGGDICMQDTTGTGAAGDPSLQINASYTIADTAGQNAFSCSDGLDGAAVLIGASGSVVKSGAGLTQFLTPTDNDGQLTVNAGTLNLSDGDGGGDAGTYSTAAGAVTNFNSSHTLTASGQITGAGTTQFSVGTTSLPAGAAFTPATVTHTGGTLSIGGSSPTSTLQTYDLQGGVLSSTRPLQLSGALSVSSGTLQGDFTTTITGGATFTKTTPGTLTVKNGADLVLGGSSALQGGGICLTDDTGSGAAGDPTLAIDGFFVIGAGADATPFSCGTGLDAPAVVVGPGGQLVKTSGGTSVFATKLRVAGGTIQLDAGQGITSAGIDQTSGLTSIATGATIDGDAPMTVSGGTLNVDGSLTGPATLTGGAVLTGAGTLSGPVTVGSGTIRPGSSPGTLTVTGNLTLGSGSTLEIEVNGPTQGSGYDYLHVLGTTTLDGTLKVLQGAGYPAPLVIDIFTFLASGSLTGTLAMLDAPALPQGKQYRLDYPVSPSFGARLVLVQSPQIAALPTADGATTAGSLLSCSIGTWNAAPAPSFSVEWLRDGQPIEGANQPTYTIGEPDAQHALACRVRAANEVGSGLATSSARDVAPVAPELVSGPSVAGGGGPGSVLSCQTGSWSGFPAPALSVEWLRDGLPATGDGAQYSIAPQDTGHSIACRVVASNGAGSRNAISTAFGVNKNAEQLLHESAPAVVARQIGLPSSTRCLKERYFRVRVRQPSGVRINAVSVTGNGKKYKANKTAGRFNTTFDLRHVGQKTLLARFTITTESGLKSVAERRYRICLPKRKPARKR